MPTGSPGRISEPWGPSRSADSERTVTRVLRSTAEILYTRRVKTQIQDELGPATTSNGAQLKAADLNRDPDPLRCEPAQDPPPELVLDQELVGERRHVADEREIQRVIAEARYELGGGLRLREEPGHLIANGLRDFLLENALDQIWIGAVVHGDPEEQRHPRLRQVVVRDDRLGHLLVGNRDDDVLQHAHAGRPPSDVDDMALDRVGDPDVVAHADRLVREQVDPREEIRERVLQGQRDRDTADAERGEDRRDLDAERAQQHQQADDVDDAANDRLAEPGDRG